jgi:2-polyprenyl-6-methoxyphenol hydroxylase-like FAD-dependent oxidoreductase
MKKEASHTTCCIVGGGPAGVMLGFLLARAGVNVTILEKHRDFFRDFRGDTVHPSTLELLWELGLLEEFLKAPHQKITSAGARLGDFSFEVANFSRLKTHCRFAAIMPQWDFLNFLSAQGQKYSNFDLRMQHEAIDLTYTGERVTGVVVRTPEGTSEIGADLVVACDGRHSILRNAARLEVCELGVPIDVLWFRVRREPNDRVQVLGHMNYGKFLVLINRNDYFQAGLIIRKNSFEQVKQRGIQAFRQDVVQLAPFLGERLEELQDWEQVKLLSVRINRLKKWHRPGLLFIGDAAHAMSPVLGVGINLAIQDAVAAANVLARPLSERQNVEGLLPDVQRHREFRTRLIQRLQAIVHLGMERVFRRPERLHAGWAIRLAARARLMQPVVLRVVGVGIWPEHVAIGRPTERRKTRRLARLIGTGAAVVAAGTVAYLSLRKRLPARSEAA